MIQSVKSEVTINYNKLHADPKQGKTLDIVLKKVKHRIVDNMNSSTADALGLSRAILCNGILPSDNTVLVRILERMNAIHLLFVHGLNCTLNSY